MRARSLALVAALALSALVLAATALAKEGITARLDAPIPADATPGTSIDVSWRLTDGDGHPFGASGIYVTLESATGAASTIGNASAVSEEDGTFAAQVIVPEGGVGGVEIALEGWRTYPDGRTERADEVFPIVGEAVEGAGASGGFDARVLALGGAVLALLAAAATVLLRRRGPRSALGRATPAG
jgi:hypothetical protein